MNRYARIEGNFPREFLLLQGQGCSYKGCRFCDYHEDVGADPYAVNAPVVRRVTGEFGVLDVINSGSVHEIDEKSMDLLVRTVAEKGVHTLWFEAHYSYRDRLAEVRTRFQGVHVKFRTGIESFDHGFRVAMNKGIPDVDPEEIRKDFDGVCLLTCVTGQTKESIVRDVEIAAGLFDYFSVNVFCPNHTAVRLDPELYRWFKEILYPKLQEIRNCEVLIENTDLGVGDGQSGE